MELMRVKFERLTRWLYSAVFTGLRAVCTQNYIEANIKNGRQRVVSRIVSVPAGTQVHIGVSTGDEPMIIKSRIISQSGSTQINYSAQSDLAYTGGAAIPIRNPNNRFKVPIGVSMFVGVTPGAVVPGVTEQYLDPFPVFGGTAAASRIGTDTLGLDYVLKENTNHVFTIDNVGSGTATVHWWQTFYEGVPDLPVE